MEMLPGMFSGSFVVLDLSIPQRKSILNLVARIDHHLLQSNSVFNEVDGDFSITCTAIVPSDLYQFQVLVGAFRCSPYLSSFQG